MEVTICLIVLRSKTALPIILVVIANLISGAWDWKLNLSKFNFTSQCCISVYSIFTFGASGVIVVLKLCQIVKLLQREFLWWVISPFNPSLPIFSVPHLSCANYLMFGDVKIVLRRYN